MKTKFKFAVAKEIITPDESMFPVKLQGFAARKGLTYEVHDDLYAKIALMRAIKDLILITLDLTGTKKYACDFIKKSIIQKYNLKSDQIMITASHSHSSVKLTEDMDDKYLPFVLEKVMKAVDRCYSNLEPGILLAAKSKINAGVSRRLPVKGKEAEWMPNWDAEIDDDLFILKLINEKDVLKGILYNFGCHATCLNKENLLMSNDFIGYLNKYLNRKYKDAITMFLTGAGGDVKPLETSDRNSARFIHCTFEQTENQGRNVAEQILKVLNGEFCKIIPCFSSGVKNIDIFGPFPDNNIVNKIQKNKKLKEYHAEKLKNSTYCMTTKQIITEWTLGDGYKMIAFGFEPTSQFGIMIKNIFSDDKTIVLGYTNDYNGYVAPYKQIKEGGYEAGYHVYTKWGFAGPLISENDGIFKNAVKALHWELMGDI